MLEESAACCGVNLAGGFRFCVASLLRMTTVDAEIFRRCAAQGDNRTDDRELLAKQGEKKRQEVVGDELGAFGGGVDAVVLNSAGDGVDVGVELGQERRVEFCRDEAVGFVELLDVVGAVVGREGDAGEDDFAAGLEQGGDDGVEVAARVGDGDAAEAVVAAEFDNDDGGVKAEDFIEAVDAVFGGVAADAGVDDFVVVAAAGRGRSGGRRGRPGRGRRR